MHSSLCYSVFAVGPLSILYYIWAALASFLSLAKIDHEKNARKVMNELRISAIERFQHAAKNEARYLQIGQMENAQIQNSIKMSALSDIMRYTNSQ